MTKPNPYLFAAGIGNTVAAFLHLGCIVFGAPWYRTLGAGEQMARMAEAGDPYPTVVTSVIVIFLSIWALYAFSGAGLIRRLPLLRTALFLISSVYLLRAVAFAPLMPIFPDNSITFWVLSSATCLILGLLHMTGLKQIYSRISHPSSLNNKQRVD